MSTAILTDRHLHPGDVVDHLPSIGLAELTDVAALQTRIDRKYVLGGSRAAMLLAGIADHARVLEIDGRRSTGYVSQYYDTAGLDSYLSTAHRRRRRFKVRTRSYETGAQQAEQNFLEVKTRGPRGMTVKHREAWGVTPSTGRLDGDGLDYVRRMLTDEGVGRPDGSWNSILRTDYRRITLYLPASGARTTIDLDLRWSAIDGRSFSVADTVVVETKSSGSASVVDRALWRMGHRPVSISKFGTGMAVLYPELPANRWRRVIQRHLTPSLRSGPDPRPDRSTS